MKIWKSMIIAGVLLNIHSCKSASESKTEGFADLFRHDNSESVSFTESMKGYFSEDPKYKDFNPDMETRSLFKSYNAAHDAGKREFERGQKEGRIDRNLKHGFMFNLTIDLNIAELNGAESRRGTMRHFEKGSRIHGTGDVYFKDAGYVMAPSISKNRLEVEYGVLGLLAKDPKRPRTLKMRYLLKLKSDEGKFYMFYGFKNVKRHSAGISVGEIWRDTSTLYISLYNSDANAKYVNIADFKPSKEALIGKGRLNILPVDFARQMTTSRGVGSTMLAPIRAMGLFGAYFSGKVIDTYVKDFIFNLGDTESLPYEPGYVDNKRLERINVPGVTRTREKFMTSDGLELGLIHYKARNTDRNRPPMLVIAGLGVNNLIFTQSHTSKNFVEYLLEKGYDLWVIEARFNTDNVNYAKYSGWSGDDTYMDYEAAIAMILKKTGKSKLDVFAHCYGAHTMLSSIMNGFSTETTDKINRLMLSQATIFTPVPRLKLKQVEALGAQLGSLKKVGIGYLSTNPKDDHIKAFSRLSNNGANFFNTVALGLPPAPGLSRGAKIANDRIRFIYGELHDVKNLSTAAKQDDGFPTYYGPAGLGHLLHIQKTVSNGSLVTAGGISLSDSSYVRKIKMPVGIIHGVNNKTWLLEGSKRTVKLLNSQVASKKHELFEIPGFGHLDTIYGSNAVNATYPLVDKFFAK